MRRMLFFETPYCGMCRAVRNAFIDPMARDGYPVEIVDCMSNPGRAVAFGIDAVPTTVVIDHDDAVYSRYVGTIDRGFLEVVLEEED